MAEEEDHISTDNFDVPLRKRVAQTVQKVNKKGLARFGKKAAKFLNKQFALVVIAFFVLSLNVVSAPVSVDATAINPLINYNPTTVAQASRDINPYIPILNEADPNKVADQVLSAIVGPESAYTPKPMLAETIDHQTADRIRRGLRKEVVTHTVQQGETLGAIASQYGLNVATILQDNELSPEDTMKIKPGTQLSIAPEKTTDSLAWLDSLHETERKAREEAEKARQAKLAQARAATAKVATSSIVHAAEDEPAQSTSGGRFRKPIGAGCYNGYHWWALDCAAPTGTAIRAAAAGRVVRADASGYNGGYGIMIEIDHGNGWRTLYAHLSRLNVGVGDQVGAGDVIAGSGNTGHSTGPHLHFEIQSGGRRLNPGSYVGY